MQKLRRTAIRRDHPRGCGAHKIPLRWPTGAMGSSPRVRGSHWHEGIHLHDKGIIPAGAGLTISLCPCQHESGDHPRGCGAHCKERWLPRNQKGSSPRVRGSQVFAPERIPVDGIIPAGAGLTDRCDCCDLCCRDHPRGCGAHQDSRPISWVRPGSSPRVRGSREVVHVERSENGIIPAGAGLTVFVCSSRRLSGDHPRGCGAHSQTVDGMTYLRGSSPRVRGSRDRPVYADRRRGIIPAGAGLTIWMTYTTCRERDHPRGCGAHQTTYWTARRTMGSSPRVRGSH